MTVPEYLSQITSRYQLGNSTEHTFRVDLNQLIESIVPAVRATNEPKRQECGAPDYIITKNDIPVGYVETKNIGDKDLSGVKKSGNKEQFDRYKKSLGNLIFTDYLDFYFYDYDQFVKKISIAELNGNTIKPLPENFEHFISQIKTFSGHVEQTIKSPKKLAEMMASKAQLLANVIYNVLTTNISSDEDNRTLNDQMLAFRQILIHDISPKSFADVYAQTITYGMFAARLNDPTLRTFSRHEAAELIPRSNPFLRNLFGYIAGPLLDDRIKWIVDDLVAIFLACNVSLLLKNYGKTTKTESAIIHFYETFLSEYDPKLRKAKGVWYTPSPVVNFIVRAVDDILISDFGLADGLADRSETVIQVKVPIKATSDMRSKTKEDYVPHKIPRVQILDPAAGTGTFLAEVVKHIHKKYDGQLGMWNGYVEKYLLPRLNGFEILMASYVMAHLQLDLLLTETGYISDRIQRFKVYLTDSLEKSYPEIDNLFAQWLSSEANAANFIKKDVPVMCILGNPPYNGESKNVNDWIKKLMDDYKIEPGGRGRLKEKNSKWINNDYVKFLRYGQHYIEKNGTGVLAFINPHGFLKDPTFRGMRWNLLKTYDKIYVIDLHGSSRPKEISPDGSVDKNVFDIRQGVCINIFVKTGKKDHNELGKVFHYDMYGKRDKKYDFLLKNHIKSIPFEELPNVFPDYHFVKKDYSQNDNYNSGFSINEFFKVGNSGVVTKRDKLNIHYNKESVIKMLDDVLNLTENICREKYSIPDDVRDWNFDLARKDINDTKADHNLIREINYRPFDKRYFYYSGKSKGVVGWPVPVVSKHLLHEDNLGFMTNKKVESGDFKHFIIYKGIVESHAVSMKEINYVFPLYLYFNNENQLINPKNREPNINQRYINEFENILKIKFISEKETGNNTFSPIDLLDYIYAVLHNTSYLSKYGKILKDNYPKIPYPTELNLFWELVKYGEQLRKIHLLESQNVNNFVTHYPISGDNIVVNTKFKLYDYNNVLPGDEGIDYLGTVSINDTQYFDDVPLSAWEFYIGGYQPAQKWLKDRKGKQLSFDDILHYQKIIVALTQTARIINEIDDTIQF